MPFGPASLLGVERFSEESEAPFELIPGDDDARKEQIIRAVYKQVCLLYTSPSPRDRTRSRMPSSA